MLEGSYSGDMGIGCYIFKGGMGISSRVMRGEKKDFMIGILV